MRSGGPNPGESIVRFFPNPANSVISFELPKNTDKEYLLEVYNLLGKRMYKPVSLNQRTPATTINLSDFNRGLYVYQLHDKSGKVIESGKFQVSK